MILDGYLHTRCIICKDYITHSNKETMFQRIAHKQCVNIFKQLKHSIIEDNGNLKRFGQRCIKYDIEPTQKALLMELVIQCL